VCKRCQPKKLSGIWLTGRVVFSPQLFFCLTGIGTDEKRLPAGASPLFIQIFIKSRLIPFLSLTDFGENRTKIKKSLKLKAPSLKSWQKNLLIVHFEQTLSINMLNQCRQKQLQSSKVSGLKSGVAGKSKSCR
jgi:hypothetical protein